MKAPFKTPVKIIVRDEWLEIVAADDSDMLCDHADFIATAVNSHGALVEAIEDAMVQLEYLDEKFEPTGTTASTVVKIKQALALAKGESS